MDLIRTQLKFTCSKSTIETSGSKKNFCFNEPNIDTKTLKTFQLHSSHSC